MKAIELPPSELKPALAGFSKVINTRSTLPVLGCIRVQPTLSGVDLQVTDLDSFVTFRVRQMCQRISRPAWSRLQG